MEWKQPVVMDTTIDGHSAGNVDLRIGKKEGGTRTRQRIRKRSAEAEAETGQKLSEDAKEGLLAVERICMRKVFYEKMEIN
uniref:Uncharacterized protein n=1 Tax=Setaria digitata TaxID=48799 RepID=A0A915PTP3_9BILA